MDNGPIRIAVAVVIIFVIASAVFIQFKGKSQTSPNNTEANTVGLNVSPRFDNSPAQNIPTQQDETLAEPIADFRNRVTKKFFGTYVSPSNSPVQPERFTGYHTGVDVEYTDITKDVPVYAVADSKVVLSEVASGYGGVFILQFRFKDKDYLAVYGHIRPSTLPKVGDVFSKGQEIAVLGTNKTTETDFERRNLHFGIIPGTKMSILGYVQNKSELSGWLDPLSFY